MKRSIMARIMALLLVFSMLPVNASAAVWDNWFNRKPQTSQSSNKKPGQSNTQKPGQNQKPGQTQKPGQNKWPSWGNKWPSWGQNTPETEPTEPEVTEPVVTEPVESELTVIESATTADNGRLLRAATYTMTPEVATFAARAGVTQDNVKYFPVTMYDYHTSDINEATDAADDDLTVREGLYFTGGSPAYTKGTVVDMSAFVAGQYYIQNIRAANNIEYSWLQAHADNKIYAVSKEDATVWTLEIEDGKYYLKTQIDGTDYYMVVGTNGDNDGYTATKTAIEIVTYSDDPQGVRLRQEDYYLCQWGGADKRDFGGYKVANDEGNGMLFYPVDSDTPIAHGGSVTKITSGYEEWNRWDKATGNNNNGDLFYTGLVQDELVNDQIVFNVPEGGIFDNDTDVKDIYEYVGLPFVLLTDDGSKYGEGAKYYSFDSDQYGAYFKGDPQSGTAEEPHNLYWGNKQPMPSGLSVGDGSTNAFLPFNGAGPYTTSAVNYHFGMRADLPFSMTPNGCVKSTDDNSAHIKFTFSGDDDVWVFIDGHLVIDLGGIHNRLDVTIDFAENTITYSENNSQDGDNATHSYNEPSYGAQPQQLFSANGVEGVIPMPRNVFAMDTEHEMQVFYLERGEGTSNARIEFNLPMHDAVMVTKDATQSWSQAAEDADLKEDPKDEDAGVDPLTDAEQAIVNNIDFGFTLYKKEAGAASFSPVANTNFYLVGRAVEGVTINQTDANGHFYLKNGQSARFITELPAEGVTYYVVEDKVPDGFVSPDFNFAGAATNNYSYSGYNDGEAVSGTASAADASQIPEQIIPMPEKDADGNYVNWPENKSYEVTVSGSIEANDSIEFICSNFLDAELPNPTALAYEDIIVIDYGLPVKIDPLANDVFRGDNIEIVYFGDDSVTLTETKGDDGVVRGEWTGTQDFRFGSVVLNDTTYGGAANRDTFTYTLTEQLTEVEVITYVIKVTGQDKQDATHETLTQNDFAVGKIYIVPATVMYYEENFSDMVVFTGSGWRQSQETTSEFQEPGVVGTTTDSIYGSDAAYLNDSFDSNGTSYYGDTTNGAIRFTYTFTGTGTTVFARTSETTGYVQFKLYKGTDTSGAYKDIYYRDTYYKDENTTNLDDDGILYNIPIYTQEGLDYGTYTVVATVAKAGTKTAGNANGSGKDFYLDGIRVMQPLNEKAALTDKAMGAYATDGEANISTVTLRQKLITDYEQFPAEGEVETEWPFAVMTDVDGDIVLASDYITIGPKEEVYLLPGQSVSFSIKYWHPDGYRMHMGMKAPFGTAKVKLGQNEFDLKNATDCYYDITNVQYAVDTKYEQLQDDNGNLYYTDAEGNRIYENAAGDLYYESSNAPVPEGVELTPVADPNNPYYVATYTFTAIDKIVSLTNIKITGNYTFVLVENTDINTDGSEGEGDDNNTNALSDSEEEEVVEEENTETPDVENTETETPEVENTETETPVVEDTETETPVVEDTETETPVVEDTETETPDAESTETVTPDVENTNTETSDVVTTDVEETDVEA